MTKKAHKSVAVIAMVGSILVSASNGQTQSADQRLAPFDASAAHVEALAENPHFRRDALFGASRNMVSLADRWSSVRPLLVQSMDDPSLSSAVVSTEIVQAFTAAKAISEVTIGASRYSGFTQSETAAAWCGISVVVGFNDTGSEIKSLLGNSGVSALGYSNSINHGTAFSYVGTPTVTSDANQAMMGEPSLACANSSDFYYASIWVDSLQSQSGVAIATSTNGGKTFSAPSIAIEKPPFTHFVDHDWLAIDRANPTDLYITYLDVDYSGTVCGVDQNNEAIPRYAIELVSSTNSGVVWSAQPTVVEEECANQSDPNVSLGGPQVAIGPSGEVIVAWEAMGEHGGSLTAREIRIARSTDQGATFAAPVKVASVSITGNGADLQGFLRANEFPSLAIGIGKTNVGVVYLTWNSSAFTVPDAISTTGTYGFADIAFSQSKDNGTTWSAPLRINNDPEGGAQPLSDQYKPSIGTDKTGRIAICFYDRRRDLNNFLSDRYCAASTDGGIKWSNTKITSVNFPALVGQDELVGPDYAGDYDTVVPDSSGLSSGFIDSYSNNAAGNPNVMTNKY
ncbi:MAG TPA: sialidase family protein [Candidatus Binataceae bacterium]